MIAPLALTTLASWRVFLEPMPAHGYEWLLLIPITLLLSIAYKGVRCEKMERYWKAVFMMTGGILVALVLMTLVGWGVVELLGMLPESS